MSRDDLKMPCEEHGHTNKPDEISIKDACARCGMPCSTPPGPITRLEIAWRGRPSWKTHGDGRGALVLQAHHRAPWVSVKLEERADEGACKATYHTFHEEDARRILRFLLTVFPDEAWPATKKPRAPGPCCDGKHDAPACGSVDCRFMEGNWMEGGARSP